ncbi:MAG: glycoside hydrolase family 3 N-terminal domain-containing protein [Candidatus Comchoanobacterales bacterium]
MQPCFCVSLCPENDAKALTITPEHQAIIAHPLVAAIVVFSYNIENTKQFKQWVADVQKTAILAGKRNGIPLLIDHEGGWIQRFSRGGFPNHPSQEWLGNMYEHIAKKYPAAAIDMLQKAGHDMGSFLNEYGLIPLAPVADVHHINNPIIASLGRGIGHNADEVIERLGHLIDGLHQANVPVCLKHFPGHGAVTQDSHLTQPIDHRDKSTLEKECFKVFKQLNQSKKIHAIMPAHILFPQIDPEHIVTYSPRWHNIMRQELNFSGALISDCLCMKGGGEQSLRQKIISSLPYLDALIICHQPSHKIIPLLNSLIDQPDNSVSNQRLEQWLHQDHYHNCYRNLANHSSIHFKPSTNFAEKSNFFQHNLQI